MAPGASVQSMTSTQMEEGVRKFCLQLFGEEINPATHSELSARELLSYCIDSELRKQSALRLEVVQADVAFLCSNATEASTLLDNPFPRPPAVVECDPDGSDREVKVNVALRAQTERALELLSERGRRAGAARSAHCRLMELQQRGELLIYNMSVVSTLLAAHARPKLHGLLQRVLQSHNSNVVSELEALYAAVRSELHAPDVLRTNRTAMSKNPPTLQQSLAELSLDFQEDQDVEDEVCRGSGPGTPAKSQRSLKEVADTRRGFTTQWVSTTFGMWERVAVLSQAEQALEAPAGGGSGCVEDPSAAVACNLVGSSKPANNDMPFTGDLTANNHAAEHPTASMSRPLAASEVHSQVNSDEPLAAGTEARSAAACGCRMAFFALAGWGAGFLPGAAWRRIGQSAHRVNSRWQDRRTRSRDGGCQYSSVENQQTSLKWLSQVKCHSKQRGMEEENSGCRALQTRNADYTPLDTHSNQPNSKPAEVHHGMKDMGSDKPFADSAAQKTFSPRAVKAVVVDFPQAIVQNVNKAVGRVDKHAAEQVSL